MAGRVSAVGLAVAAVGSWAKPDGTCGYQCTEDSQCGGCGAAGRCSCPDGETKFPQISCSCVSAPANPPQMPVPDAGDATWPTEWVAEVDAWCYSDFTDKSSVAQGKFYYNADLGRTRADWTPYINGKNAKQVWVGATAAGEKSYYYVASGPICIKFPISDPGVPGKPQVGIERPDWMAACNASGLAKYVGREQVRAGPSYAQEDEWADHFSCHLDYAAANQAITFQNWHSLGLGSTPKGLPLRVTGGNSAPDSQKGSPRLNSVWYYNFQTGAGSTQASDFDPPNFGGKLCVPVGLEEAEAFFGHEAQVQHVFDPAFHRRAHFLPHARASASDLRRARRPKPSPFMQGKDFEDGMQKLNAVLLREKGLRTRACGNFTLPELHEMQHLLFDARTHELDAVYKQAGDTRRMAHPSAEALRAEQRAHAVLHEGGHRAAQVARDGACHEMVMWYVHHLSESARESIKDMLELPLLPQAQHSRPEAEAQAGDEESAVHQRYTEQVSCAVCHVTGSQSDVATLVV